MQISEKIDLKTANSPTEEKTPLTHSSFIGFDPKNPPDPKLIDTCVHCGFCLSTCPSYRVIGKEMASPRGRIYLMDAINEGEAPFKSSNRTTF